MDGEMDGIANGNENTDLEQNSSPPFELLKLPVEIQQHIFAKVESKGLIQLAATCKTLNTAINDSTQDERYALIFPHILWKYIRPVRLLAPSLQSYRLIHHDS